MPANESKPDPPKHSWLYRRVALPVFALLRLGASPERLAWSLAVGVVVGINPVLGSTTLICLLAAFLFRLNIAASQLSNHLVYPLQLALLVPFLQFGARLFATTSITISPSDLLHRARTSPLALSRELWFWEAHALAVWLAVALFTAPVLAALLIPLLHRLQRRIEQHHYPLVAELLPLLDTDAHDKDSTSTP